MINIMYDEIRPYPQTKIDQPSQKLFDLFSTSRPDLKKIEQLVNSIVKRSDSSGLAVFLASEVLWQLPNLAPKILKKIQLMKMDFINKDPVIADLTMRKQVLVDSIDQFCQQDKVQTSYFQLDPVDAPNVEQILEFICQQNASHCKSSYSYGQTWIFDSYTHPERNNVHGVWMSQNGEHFTNEALLKLERAKNIAFRQTYLAPAALTSVKKNIPV